MLYMVRKKGLPVLSLFWRTLMCTTTAHRIPCQEEDEALFGAFLTHLLYSFYMFSFPCAGQIVTETDT